MEVCGGAIHAGMGAGVCGGFCAMTDVGEASRSADRVAIEKDGRKKRTVLVMA